MPTVRVLRAATLALGALLSACAAAQRIGSPAPIADAIYSGGTILTVNDAAPRAEALAVKDGRILAVGTRDAVMKTRGEQTRMVDLLGRTMAPGFIDAHGHIADYALLWHAASLAPPPVGKVTRIADLQRALSDEIAAKRIPADRLVLGNGYDDALLAEHRHPTRRDLDAVSKQHAICVIHASGHLASCNSLALARMKIAKGTPDPKGGVIRRDPRTKEPTGVLEEQAVFAVVALAPRPSAEQMSRDFAEIQSYYASLGITTAQDGQTLPPTSAFLTKAAADGRLILDVVSYPKWTTYEQVLTPELRPGVYANHLKIGGVKISQDGSPQGRTAYLSEPYFEAPAGQKADYRGYPIMPQAELDAWVDRIYARNLQLLVHCNGDACAEMMLDAIEKAQRTHGAGDRRPVMIHAQTVRDDQLDRMKALGILPSFFPAHTYFWGDWHRDVTLGPTRAARISPARSAELRGMRFSIHNDTPVVPPDILPAIGAAVNRTTRTGKVLGTDQRVAPDTALKAVTIWAAYQYFEEGAKGSLEPGKLADLVILSDDPLSVDPARIKEIRVLETIKEGRTIYEGPGAAPWSRSQASMRDQPSSAGSGW